MLTHSNNNLKLDLLVLLSEEDKGGNKRGSELDLCQVVTVPSRPVLCDYSRSPAMEKVARLPGAFKVFVCEKSNH